MCRPKTNRRPYYRAGPGLLAQLLLPGVLALLGLGACRSANPEPAPRAPVAPFYRGVDLSFSPEAEAAGTVFTDAGQPGTALEVARRHGANLVRLRLWHTPANGHGGLPEVAAYARRAHQAGLALLLDIHYADSWADPGQQPTPQAWRDLPPPLLTDSMYAYTRRVLRVLAAQQTPPALVQIGNEINAGILWPTGRVGSAADFPALAALLKAGLRAVADEDPDHRIRTVLHYAGPAGSGWFFDQLARQQVRYDVQALSYYPQFHGRNLPALEQQLRALVGQFGKDVLLAETAYPFTLGYNDLTNNILGRPDQLADGYAATPDGQRAFLLELQRQLRTLPDGHGLGFCYWAPDWVTYRGSGATDGSSWENQALFDFQNTALPAWDAFGP